MRKLWSKLRLLLTGRDALSADLREELDAHLDLEIQDLLARGMTIEQARETARRNFGNATAIRETASEAWAFGFLENFLLDLAHAARILRKSPGFTAAALLTLALGIGGNTMMFAVIDAVLLRPLQYREPDRLVRLSLDTPSQTLFDAGFSQERFDAVRASARSFSELSASFIATESMTLSGGAEPLALKGARVSYNFLQALGVQPPLGRAFLAAEDRRGARPVAMISWQLWKSRYAGDPQVIGRTAMLNAVPHTIVGVLPQGFQFPLADIDIWVPRPSEFSALPPQAWPASAILIGLGRLKPGTSVEQAQAELDVLSRQFGMAHPRNANQRVRVMSWSTHLVEHVRVMLWTLFGAVGLVLLVACANMAGLLLARSAARSAEFSIRAALGAARSRLIAQLLAESLVLSLLGAAAGLCLARWGLAAIEHIGTVNLPRAGEIRMDGLVLGFTAALTVATAILFGFIPALRASRPQWMNHLRASGEGRGTAAQAALGWSPRGLLVTLQVALSIVLLIGATLLLRTLLRLYSQGPGFNPDHLLTMDIALPPALYNTGQKLMTFYAELDRRARSVPGVQDAAVAMTLPMSSKWAMAVQPAEEAPVPLPQRMQSQFQSVSPDYFETLKIPLRRGREFTERDEDQNSPPIAIVNEALVRRLWPAYPLGLDPVGRELRLGGNGIAQIVGIVADVRESGLAAQAEPEFYLPIRLFRPQRAVLIVRTTGDLESFVRAIRGAVLATDKDELISAVKTMNEVLSSSVGQQRLALWLLGTFAAVAVLLATVGLFGLISYSVTQRTREVGIRRALGARPGDILRLIVGQGLALTVAGIAIGVGGALALTRVMKGLLFGVSATDPATFAAVAAGFLVVAVAASLLPAWRAARVDPMIALR